MNTQKGFSSILLILLGAVVIGGGWFYFEKDKSVKSEQQNFEISDNVFVEDTDVVAEEGVETQDDLYSVPLSANEQKISVLSPNGGEVISYGSLYMAGDLMFSWKSENKPTSNFKAYIIDSNQSVVRDDKRGSIIEQGDGTYVSSFVGESNIKRDTNYKIKVCDLFNGIAHCDVSDGYFQVQDTLPADSKKATITSISSQNYPQNPITFGHRVVLSGQNLIDNRGDQNVVIEDAQGNIGFVASSASHVSDGTHVISFTVDSSIPLCRTPYSDKGTCDNSGWNITPGRYKVYVLKFHNPNTDSGTEMSNQVDVEFDGKY